MKKNIFCLLLLFIGFSQSGCKKFLDVTSVEKLSGNQYWNSPKDFEAYINNLYSLLWAKLSGSAFISSTGELRMGEIKANIGGRFNSTDQARRTGYVYLANNDLNTLINGGTTSTWNASNNYTASNTYSANNYTTITDWSAFYTIIQSANILYEQANRDDKKALTSEEKKKYLAEAVYIRSLCYFLMVRIYGDVPYYTDANHSEPLPRTSFVTVLNNCITDLNTVKNDLPYHYTEPTFNGVRANVGGAISLLMNMNMWNAGFDQVNKNAYYDATTKLGSEIIASNQYSLLPISSFTDVMLANSNEGLIEMKQSINYATSLVNKLAYPGEAFVAFPDKANIDVNGLYSHASYTSAYMHQLFDKDLTDQRYLRWFDNIFSADGQFGLRKFSGQVSSSGFPDWGLIISRYADVILLQSEALAELGRDAEAIQPLNMVRTRASAKLYDQAIDGNLKDAIYLERCKELIGEGYHFFDLVRTGRIMSSTWTSKPLTTSQFAAGAWTWPISASARTRNPFITFNDYWL